MFWSGKYPFSSFTQGLIPEKSGLYAFYDNNNRIVYIGETGNLNRRFSEYTSGDNPCVTRNAKFFSYRLEPNKNARQSEEERLIRQLQPTCNKVHR